MQAYSPSRIWPGISTVSTTQEELWKDNGKDQATVLVGVMKFLWVAKTTPPPPSQLGYTIYSSLRVIRFLIL